MSKKKSTRRREFIFNPEMATISGASMDPGPTNAQSDAEVLAWVRCIAPSFV
jgi:hypothetical protein